MGSNLSLDQSARPAQDLRLIYSALSCEMPSLSHSPLAMSSQDHCSYLKHFALSTWSAVLKLVEFALPGYNSKITSHFWPTLRHLLGSTSPLAEQLCFNSENVTALTIAEVGQLS